VTFASRLRTASTGADAQTTSDASLRLDDLLALEPARLAALYARAATPSIPELSGDLRGRMLAWEKIAGSAATLLRSLASSGAFPWRGKSFSHDDDARGRGENRLFRDSFRVLRFTTEIGPSRAGAFDAVQLDYDHRSNPRPIRAVKDEVRTVRPGLWLGQAWIQWTPTSQARLVLWFGLERP